VRAVLARTLPKRLMRIDSPLMTPRLEFARAPLVALAAARLH
jgi:hypothetical protein